MMEYCVLDIFVFMYFGWEGGALWVIPHWINLNYIVFKILKYNVRQIEEFILGF